MRIVTALVVFGLAFALGQRTEGGQLLTPDDILVIEFEIQPPYLCGATPCTPDTLRLNLGMVEIVEKFGEQTARLYMDGVPMGTWLGVNRGSTLGVTQVTSGAWSDANQIYAAADPVVVDFQTILSGTTNGRIEVRILMGSIAFEDNFPSVRLSLLRAQNATTAGTVSGTPTVTAIRIEADPEPNVFVVDSEAGDADADPGDGYCATATGECTLSAAIEESNALPGSNCISIPDAGVYPGGHTITESLTIRGSGADTTVIDGGGSGSVLTIDARSKIHRLADVGLSELKLTGGDAPTVGGGIALQHGDLTLIQVEVSANAAGTNGGGINQGPSAGMVWIILSTIRGNTAGGSGGGIHHNTDWGSLWVDNCEINDNVALSGGGGAISVRGALDFMVWNCVLKGNAAVRAGAIEASGWTADISGCRVSGNSARSWAGGVALYQVEAYLEDNTFDDNQGQQCAGGLYAFDDAIVYLDNSTFSGNRGKVGGAIALESPFDAQLNSLTVTQNSAEEGGGIALLPAPGIGLALLSNSVVAANQASVAGPDCRGGGGQTSFVSRGHNLIGDGSDCVFPTNTGDQIGTSGAPIDPLLAPLAETGGETPTHALLAGSPLIDAGSPEPCDGNPGSCMEFDQRWQLRPYDGDDDGSAICDIGAHEMGDFDEDDIPDLVDACPWDAADPACSPDTPSTPGGSTTGGHGGSGGGGFGSLCGPIGKNLVQYEEEESLATSTSRYVSVTKGEVLCRPEFFCLNCSLSSLAPPLGSGGSKFYAPMINAAWMNANRAARGGPLPGAAREHLARLLREVPLGPRFDERLRDSTFARLREGDGIGPALERAVNAMELDRRTPPLREHRVPEGERHIVDMAGVARLTFHQVERPGVVSLAVENGCESGPRGFATGWPVATYCFEFTGELGREGRVDVELYLGGASFHDRLDSARLFEWHGKTWRNVTTAVDQRAARIRGSTSSLGTYVVAQPTYGGKARQRKHARRQPRRSKPPELRRAR